MRDAPYRDETTVARFDVDFKGKLWRVLYRKSNNLINIWWNIVAKLPAHG